ncbi:MAG TPA: dihydrofolate reductase family protein [Chloroflexota bacterium]|nr:dihydrofolate reductase family protein [Chloroflexota bacterium]
MAKLKQETGKNINVSGSVTLVAWLFDHGLVDELRLLVMPVIVGRGKHLFTGDSGSVALKLVESTALSNGVLHLTYVPIAT